MWLVLAFCGPILWAASTHIDKYLVDRYFRNSDTTVLMVFTAMIGALMLPPIGYWAPGVFAQKPTDVGVLGASGILYMAAMLFYLRALQTEEASVVAPLLQTTTLFAFLFGYVFLGETLTRSALAGGTLIVAGTLLISVDLSTHERKLKPRLMLLMLGCAAVLALSTVIFKFFAVRDQFWTTTFWTYAGEAVFGLGIVCVPRYRRQFAGLFVRNPGSILLVNGANELINLCGALAVRFASLLAPVALVSAVSSTSTLFVFLFGILLTLFVPGLGREKLSRRDLAQKAAAACLMAAGVAVWEVSAPL